MRKSTIFISAVLTTFALVMLYRVAAAYSDNKVAATVAAQPAAHPTTITEELLAAPDPVLGPVDAAQVAAQVIGNTNLGSAESSSYNGVNAYRITFTNNDVVYVGMDGQILSVQIAPVTPAPPIVVNAAPTKKHKDNHGNVSAPGVSNSNDDHGEGHDD